MAAARGVHRLLKNACRVADFKSKGGLSRSPVQILTTLRPSGSYAVVNVSPKTQQLLNTLTKNNKWKRSVLDSVNRTCSSSVLCLLTSGNSPLTTLASLCSSSDELSSDGDEDSTNRKKRIYLVEHLNDDP